MRRVRIDLDDLRVRASGLCEPHPDRITRPVSLHDDRRRLAVRLPWPRPHRQQSYWRNAWPRSRASVSAPISAVPLNSPARGSPRGDLYRERHL
jgi:hypothetical protein